MLSRPRRSVEDAPREAQEPSSFVVRRLRAVARGKPDRVDISLRPERTPGARHPRRRSCSARTAGPRQKRCDRHLLHRESGTGPSLGRRI